MKKETKPKEWSSEVSYSFNLVCYPESLEQPLPNIINGLLFLTEYAYILHDSDVDENGQIKKPHYHVYLKFTKRIRYVTIANRFNIAPNKELIQCCRDKVRTIRYFIHIDDIEKYQYPDDKLITYNIDRDKLLSVSYVDKETAERNDFQTILDYIAENSPTMWQLVQFVLQNDLIATYRRCYAIFKDLLNEMRGN